MWCPVDTLSSNTTVSTGVFAHIITTPLRTNSQRRRACCSMPFTLPFLDRKEIFLACFIDSDVLVSRDTSLDDPRCKSNLCKNPWLRCNCNWPPCTWCSLLAKTKALSMSSPSQPGSTVSLSTSCCTLKVGTFPHVCGAAQSAPEMTLRWNFFPEPVLPGTSSQDLPAGYAGNGPPSGSCVVFKEA